MFQKRDPRPSLIVFIRFGRTRQAITLAVDESVHIGVAAGQPQMLPQLLGCFYPLLKELPDV
jgi:hypothetical protein